jgi:hypothetical protein
MLPLTEVWYRRLLAAAIGLGLAGGLFALAYSGVTNAAISRAFGDPNPDPWSGQWWWIPLIAAGAVAVAFLRNAWNLPDDVPGAIAYARAVG